MSSDNYFNPTRFAFNIKKLPEFSKMVQSVTIPGINAGSTDIQTPFKVIPLQSDHLTFDDLLCTFKINEDFSNYIEIFNWLIGINFPKDWKQYLDLKNTDPITGESIYADATLILLNSAQNAQKRIEFYDTYPINLSGPELTTLDTGVEFITSTVTFKFSYMKFTNS